MVDMPTAIIMVNYMSDMIAPHLIMIQPFKLVSGGSLSPSMLPKIYLSIDGTAKSFVITKLRNEELCQRDSCKVVGPSISAEYCIRPQLE